MKTRTLFIGALWSAIIVPFSGAESRWDVGAEWVGSNDVDLLQLNANRRWEIPEKGWSGDLSLAANGFDLDYSSVAFDLFGQDRSISETSLAIQGLARHRVREDFEWTFSAGGYDGYTNFRSIWLAEYYRQQFADRASTAGDDYLVPNPRGGGLGVGFRWEYVRASAFLEITVSGRRDQVAPGYEIDFSGLIRGRTYLNGSSLVIASENLLSARVRSRFELSASRVSERDWRYNGQWSLNTAVGERGVLRWFVGGATENPQFESWYTGGLWDWELNDQWSVFAEGRYYEDNGEIENALLFTSAAPSLKSTQASVGMRWTNDSSVWRVKVGRSRGDYDSPDPRLDFFQNLYADRHWTLVQLSYSHSF
ncbi:MAG: hypothetical protein SynsKO_45650 [Synoicihabitans sp.]